MNMTEFTDADHRLTGRREQMATRAVFLISGTAMAAWAPLVPFAKERLGVDDAAFGFLLLCLGLGSIIAMPLAGPLAGRFGCRKLILTGVIGLISMLPCLALAGSVIPLAVALAIFGVSVGVVSVAMSIQSVIVEDDSGKSMMSGFHGLFSLGGILGAGVISLFLGLGISPVGATLTACLILTALLLFSFSGLLPYGSRNSADQAPLFVLPRGIVILIGVMCFLVFLGEGSVLDWSALFLISDHSVDPATAGLGYTIFAIAMTTGRLSGDWIVSKLGGVRVVILGGLVAASGFLLVAFAHDLIAVYGGFALVGLGASNIAPVFFTAAGRQERMPANPAIAAVSTLGYAGILIGPALIGVVAQYSGLATAFVLISVGFFFVAFAGRSLGGRRA